MKEILQVEKKRESISLVSGITFSNVSGWFGATKKDLKMDIMMPKDWVNHRPCPCLIWICGGAFMSVDRSVWIPDLTYLAEAGFVVASVEYRTSNEARFPAQLIDVKSAVRFLRAHAKDYCIDSERIYAAGESAGGTLAGLLGVTSNHIEFERGNYLDYSSSVAKVVDFYGLMDLSKGKIPVAEGLPKWILDAFLGDDYSEAAAKAASAIAYVDDNTPPFFILHGMADDTVPVSQSTHFYEVLQEKELQADLYLLEGAIHGDALFYQGEIMEKIAAFLNA